MAAYPTCPSLHDVESSGPIVVESFSIQIEKSIEEIRLVWARLLSYSKQLNVVVSLK